MPSKNKNSTNPLYASLKKKAQDTYYNASVKDDTIEQKQAMVKNMARINRLSSDADSVFNYSTGAMMKRNLPPMDSTLEEIQGKISNMPIEDAKKLLNVDWRKKGFSVKDIPTVYKAAKNSNVNLSDMGRYYKHMKGLMDQGYTYGNGGDLMMNLPQYGFGSWLKENAGGLLKGAGSLVSLIPGVGQIAGPVLGLAGAAADRGKQNSQDKAMMAAQQTEIDTRMKADAKASYLNNKSIRESNMFNNDLIGYGSTFAYGGNLMMDSGNSGNPQIVNYTDKADKHSEGIGGVPVDMKGNPTMTSRMSAVGMVEGGELIYNGFVFSNNDKMKLKKHGKRYTS